MNKNWHGRWLGSQQHVIYFPSVALFNFTLCCNGWHILIKAMRSKWNSYQLLYFYYLRININWSKYKDKTKNFCVCSVNKARWSSSFYTIWVSLQGNLCTQIKGDIKILRLLFPEFFSFLHNSVWLQWSHIMSFF